jgi:phospholipid/cholesterol/gamma-HCH transport system substrate-binding protein
VLAGFVGLAVALYQKAFAPVVSVTLLADRAGNQLSQGADVKARGAIVGRVESIAASPDGARLQLALDPDKVELLPADVRAQLLPKTLFGEKFVALLVDDGSSAPPLADGDVIRQDRSQTAIETAQALDNALPLLRTLRPEHQEEQPGVQEECMRDDSRESGAAAAPFSPASYDRATVDLAVASALGVLPDEVPDVAMLLFGPVARDTVVRVS